MTSFFYEYFLLIYTIIMLQNLKINTTINQLMYIKILYTNTGNYLGEFCNGELELFKR